MTDMDDLDLDLDQERPLEGLTDEQLKALGGTVGVHVSIPAAPDADPDEEPPEPEGHKLSKEVSDWLGSKEYFHGPLPHDIAAIWAAPPFRVADEATARILIGAWGVDEFRGSTLHRAALQDAARKALSHEARTRFKTEREKKAKR